MDIPSRVVTELLKRHKLPNEIVELIYWLIVRETEENYPALNPISSLTNTEEIIVAYTHALHSVLERLPKISALDSDKFNATIFELAEIEPEHLYSLNALKYWGYKLSNKVPKDYDFGYTHKLWRDFLDFRVSFDIPTRIRFEHTHIIGATGSGKTQLLQKFISQDIKTSASIIVMAPKGTMVPTLSALQGIDPKRLVIIRPQDPIALNIFDIGATDTDSQTNNVVGLINYIFSSILDAETTSKQTALLNYCIRLILKSGGTLLTLRSLMKAESLPEEYRKYLPQLSNSAQEFFTYQFGNKKTYGETKEQILWRLDFLLENSTIERIFSQPKTRLNMGREMERGAVILIDTSIKELGESGSTFLGRFFIALVTLASQQRDTTKPLRPVWFYIDEASTYLSSTIENLLERARESRVGLILAHQQLSQLTRISPQLEASVMTNTSIKIVGGCSYQDAVSLAKEMGVTPEALKNQPPLNFKLKVKGFIRSVGIEVEAGYLERMPKRTDLDMVLEQNRVNYGGKEMVTKPTEPDDDIESLNKI